MLSKRACNKKVIYFLWILIRIRIVDFFCTAHEKLVLEKSRIKKIGIKKSFCYIRYNLWLLKLKFEIFSDLSHRRPIFVVNKGQFGSLMLKPSYQLIFCYFIPICWCGLKVVRLTFTLSGVEALIYSTSLIQNQRLSRFFFAKSFLYPNNGKFKDNHWVLRFSKS